MGRWTVSLDFHSLYDFFATGLPLGPELPKWLAFGLTGFTLAFLVINALMMATALYTWFERRALGRFQVRLGPNRWGPFGIFQPIADGIKLVTKEDTIPDVADRPAFTIAPILLMVPVLLVVAVVPFGKDSFLGRLNIGILFIVGVTSVSTIAIFYRRMGLGEQVRHARFDAGRRYVD